jgi:hypothetical protein
MKVELTTFLSAANGITLVCLPETQIESDLIKGFGRHGQVRCGDGKLKIEWDFREKAETT